MSFKIEIGTTKGPKNKIKKEFTVVATFEGVLNDSCSILNPVIRFRTGSSQDYMLKDINQCNYMYIENFNRYYFITDFNIIRNGIIDISGHVDVLMTYADEILANPGLILRSESNYSKLLDDGCFKVYNDDHIVCKKFDGNTFTDGTFILAVAGS